VAAGAEDLVRDTYHDELDAILQSVVDMTRQVAHQVNFATRALLEADRDLAQAVVAGDDSIDTVYRDVEQRTFELLARQQPVAGDLRVIITGLRMVADLERMGDLALHIAKLADLRFPQPAIPETLQPTILEMGQVAERIVTKCGNVVATQDVRLAQELERDDDVMDDLHRRLFTVLLAPDWAGGVEPAIDVTLCGRYYERFCDHAVSVARRVIYLVTGERSAWVDLPAGHAAPS
jgi:phosphate transport system protein